MICNQKLFSSKLSIHFFLFLQLAEMCLHSQSGLYLLSVQTFSLVCFCTNVCVCTINRATRITQKVRGHISIVFLVVVRCCCDVCECVCVCWALACPLAIIRRTALVAYNNTKHINIQKISTMFIQHIMFHVTVRASRPLDCLHSSYKPFLRGSTVRI